MPVNRLAALAAAAAFACSAPRDPGRDATLERLPIDTSRFGSLEVATQWQHRETTDVDLNGDGAAERLVLAADVAVGDQGRLRGQLLWEHGHRWAVFVEDTARRTLLYSAFLPNGVAEVAIGVETAAGRRDVVIVERTPHHSRTLVIAYERAGVARLVSEANYPLARWLRNLAQMTELQSTERDPAPRLPDAPWSRDTLNSSDIPAEYLAAWRTAENRSTCAPLAPRTVRLALARPRLAHFAGGWGVAYDTPDQRSAFGVAGTGTVPGEGMTWPNWRRWSDGSYAGYGPEGGTGPNQLAYLRVAGQGCLYNVWSRVGKEDLEYLLGKLRIVRVDTAARN